MNVIRVNVHKARRIMGLYAVVLAGVSIWHATIPNLSVSIAFFILVLFGPAVTSVCSRYYVMGDDWAMLRATRVYPRAAALLCLAGVCIFEMFKSNQSIFRSSWPCALPWFALPMILNQFMAIATIVPLFDRIRRFPRSDECPECLYDINGNTSGRCPECGHVIGEEQHRALRYLRHQSDQSDRTQF